MPGSLSAGRARSKPVTSPSTLSSKPSSPPAINPSSPAIDAWYPVPLGVRAKIWPAGR